MIAGFRDEFAFLSNFFPVTIWFEGEAYPSVEHAFQAAKTEDPEVRCVIRSAINAGKAKKLGRQTPLRPDWDMIRVGVMTDLVRQKFQDAQLRAALLATGDRYLEETNWWGDRFWGVCNGMGENRLGKILMAIREEIRIEPGG